MRILSQENLYNIDLPYEMCGLSMGYMGDKSKFFVYAYFQGADNKMAEYSSAEKARKAMEMLQKAYSPILVMKEQENGIEPNIKPNNFVIGSTSPMPKVEILDNFYFQFPTDDKVVV